MTIHANEQENRKMVGSLAFNIHEWIEQYDARPDGRFSTQQLDRTFGLLTKRQKNNRKAILRRLVKEGLITRVAYGIYRCVNAKCQPVDWRKA
jgi:hypothetical protein